MAKNNSNYGSDLRKILWIWAVISIIVDVLFWFLVGPHMAPGRLTETAKNDQMDLNILMICALPVIVGVWTYWGWSLTHWGAKQNGPEPIGGPAARSNLKVQTWWIASSSVLVLALAIFGTLALIMDHGSGGGEGPNPVWMPDGPVTQVETAALNGTATWSPGKILPVQVIGQQWKFTYRYPTFGGFETQQLILPANTTIVFNVTSLDVIHSFWAYQLGVKADANPGVNDVAFTETKGTGNFEVRCSELCGIWHGAMYNSGAVVSQSTFQQWATSTQAATAANTALLPKFAWTYTPDANGAAGGYYPDGNLTPYSSVQVYGAKQS